MIFTAKTLSLFLIPWYNGDVINTTAKISFFGISDVGLVREHNEDRWKIVPNYNLCLLADGMGGHQAGEVAAEETIAFLQEYCKKMPKESEQQEDFFAEAIVKANYQVYSLGVNDPKLAGMGTTLVLLCVTNDRAVIAHVGDSRVYRLRDKALEQLTEDHSLVNELISLGAVRQEDATQFPYKNMLTRAIGTNPNCVPDVRVVPSKKGDLYLLCSDGLSNYLSNDIIKKNLLQNSSLEKIGTLLVDLAKEQGGGDNITLILVKVE